MMQFEVVLLFFVRLRSRVYHGARNWFTPPTHVCVGLVRWEYYVGLCCCLLHLEKIFLFRFCCSFVTTGVLVLLC
mgnify:CR=1 FL=1